MKFLKFISLLLLNAFMAMLIGSAVAPALDVSALSVAKVVFCAPPGIYLLIKLTASALSIPIHAKPVSGLFMAVQVENWVDYIMENLYKDNEFLEQSFSESDNVLGGVVVHIPQAGAKPTVVKNRSSFPATAVRRTDSDVTYPLDTFSTDPTHIPNLEKNEISYDKQESVFGDHRQSLSENIADEILYKWVNALPAGNILRTTGSLVASALSPGATGTRRKFVKESLADARKLMNKQKISKQNRFALIPSDLYAELLEDSDLKQRDGVNGGETDFKEGKLVKLYGFVLIERAETTVFDNASTPAAKVPGAATATSDNQAVVCWQKECVARAVGTINFFEKTNDPQFYGDVYSADVKAGGRRRRANSEGVVAIVQAAV
jgi:hypothetical protein